MQTTYAASAGDKVSFFWKVSSESSDYLRFYIDGQLQNYISGEKDWEKKSYALSAGSRTLKWVYEKDRNHCGWVLIWAEHADYSGVTTDTRIEHQVLRIKCRASKTMYPMGRNSQN